MNLPGGGHIDTSWSSIRTLAIIVMAFTWIYIFTHPSEEDDK
tara:strand:+ start:93 stop:218 length:126 start_codon:yes stop_codon:yes gene_type:complete